MEAEAMDSNSSKSAESVQITEKDKPQPLHVSVTEKIIFCLDPMIVSNCSDDTKVDVIFDILLLYMKMKKKISTKQTEFQCLLWSQGKVSLIDIHEGKDLRCAFMPHQEEEETHEFDLSIIFSALAQMLEFPHPQLCSEMVPPPWVYHCLLLFAHNIYPPVIKDTNTFDFLVQNPFFTCDTIYIYNNSLPNNDCETIGSALFSMYDVLNGYFFAVSSNNVDQQYSVFAQLLGHPLMRPPQNKARFNLKQLISQENSK